MNKVMRTKPLKSEIRDGQLSITIGVDTLCHAVGIGRGYGLGEITVTDNDVFAAEVLRELAYEEEDGTTPIYRMLDDTVTKAIENGAKGANYDGISQEP